MLVISAKDYHREKELQRLKKELTLLKDSLKAANISLQLQQQIDEINELAEEEEEEEGNDQKSCPNPRTIRDGHTRTVINSKVSAYLQLLSGGC